jgi:protein OS-9
MRRTRGGKAGKPGEPTEVIIELGEDTEGGAEVTDKLMEALRSAGYDVLNAEFLGLNKEDGNDKKEDNKNANKKDEKKRRVRRSTDDVDEYARDEL